MVFRDETEALRQRVRSLQESLDGLRRERNALIEATRALERGVEARAKELSPPASLIRVMLGVGALAVVVSLVLARASAPGSSSSRTYYGRAVSVSGAASILTGARCTVFVGADGSEDYDAKLSVLCEGRVIYGGGSLGYVGCDEDDDVNTRCVDDAFSADGGDPKMTFDAASRTVRLEEAAPAWSVQIALEGAVP